IYNFPIIFSIHPRCQKKLLQNNIPLNSLIVTMPALGFFDYCHLQINSFCVVSDSGSLQEESAILNFPAVSIRESIERQEAIEKGNTIIGNLETESILDSINILT